MGRLNKPEIPGYRYRSPGQTNARDLTPNLREDVIESQRADTERIRRGLDTAETRPQNRRQVQEAGGRATTRTGGRAGLAGLALEAGYMGGRELDERTGVGKKMVEGSERLKAIADKMGSSNRVSSIGCREAKPRIDSRRRWRCLLWSEDFGPSQGRNWSNLANVNYPSGFPIATEI